MFSFLGSMKKGGQNPPVPTTPRPAPPVGSAGKRQRMRILVAQAGSAFEAYGSTVETDEEVEEHLAEQCMYVRDREWKRQWVEVEIPIQ